MTFDQDRRIAGLGIATPFELWSWADAAGAPHDVMEEWRDRDIRADLQAEVPFPVYLQNVRRRRAVQSWCSARAMRRAVSSISTSAPSPASSIVLNGALYGGPTGNAGALGSMPVPRAGRRATAADRYRLDRDARTGTQRQGARRIASVVLAAGLGRIKSRNWTNGSRQQQGLPMRSSPHRPSSDFERR